MTLAVNLPLDIREAAFARRSAKSVPWSVRVVREIGPEDLALINSALSLVPSGAAPLAKIRAPHHMMAKLVADGKPQIEISRITGYSTARIRTMLNDPGFQELVAHYEEQSVFASPDIKAQVEHVTLSALQELQERIEEDPSQFSIKELREITEAGLDRIGHGKITTTRHEVADTSAVLQLMREQLELEGRATQILPRAAITTTYTEVPNEQAPSPTEPLESGEDE